jgi:phosphoribosylamine--glycine ligase
MFWSGDNALYRETIAKMAGRLAETGFVGYFDINCIATPRAIYPLECTPRFGYPTLSIQMEGVTSRWGDFFHGLARGEMPALKTKKGFQIGVVIAVPPFPFEDPSAFRRYSEGAVVIFKKPATDGVYPGDIKLVENDWVLAGQTGYALVCTGSGPTMEDAAKEAYARVKNVIIPNMFYRTDIGDRWRRDGDLLRTWGCL